MSWYRDYKEQNNDSIENGIAIVADMDIFEYKK